MRARIGRGPAARAAQVLAVLLTAGWAGGLAVYGGIVLPTLHDQMGVADAAWITRDVTRGLNALGAAGAAAWLAAFAAERPGRPGAALFLILASALIIQYALHPEMAARMDAGRIHRSGFYPLHRAYLIAATVQWIASLGLIARAVRR